MAPSSSHTTARSGDGTVTITPSNESLQNATVIICHGLGDTADGLADVATHLSSRLPYAKFILPTAPTRKVTLNMGMTMPAWYDIVGLDKRSNENCDGIEESRKRIEGLVADETGAGIRRGRIVLAGFSQGAALSLYTGMLLPPPAAGEDDGGVGGGPLAGIVMMSGYLPHESGFKVSPGLEGTPVWHGHGGKDPLISMAVAEESRKTAMMHGVRDYKLVPYPGLAHSVSPAELMNVTDFLLKVLPPTDDEGCRIKLKDPGEMSVKELKAAIAKAGLGSQAVGFMEKSEFVDLVRKHREGKL